MTDLDADAVEAAASALRDRGGEVDAVHLDVRDPDAVEGIARHVVDRFGGLHIAVNNAGVVNRGVTWELSLDDWHRVLDVNLWVGSSTASARSCHGSSRPRRRGMW